jgi:hypothetical protein
MEKATFEGMKAPLDQGFVQSFAVEDVEGQRAFFDTYGFVVVRDVLDHAEVDVRTLSPSPSLSTNWRACEQATVDELWKDTEALANRATFDGVRRWCMPVRLCACWCNSLARSLTGDTQLSRDDASMWDVWPSKSRGILGNDIAAGQQAWSNRQHPRVHQVYSNLFGTEKLIAAIDRYGAAAQPVTAHDRAKRDRWLVYRYGIMRPTKDVKLVKKTKTVDDEGNEVEATEEEVVEDRPQWQTTEQWFHWDLAVWAWFGLAPCPDTQGEQELHDAYVPRVRPRGVRSRLVAARSG